jgi:hypothetical protein
MLAATGSHTAIGLTEGHLMNSQINYLTPSTGAQNCAEPLSKRVLQALLGSRIDPPATRG